MSIASTESFAPLQRPSPQQRQLPDNFSSGPGSRRAAPAGNMISSAPSFSFFKVPPLPTKKATAAYTTAAPSMASFPNIGMPEASSFPKVGSPPAGKQFAASCSSFASDDAQEELNLHPSLQKLNKASFSEADPTAILASAMGSALATSMPAAWAERQVRQPHPMQRTESQLVMAQAQHLALTEQRRRAQAQSDAQKTPSPIRALLARRSVPQKIYLMRHGESEANVSRRDVPDPNLTPLGLAQAKSWQETIGDLQPDIVLVSPLRRAVQTACHAFSIEEVPFLCCRFAREIGWSCNENTIHSTPAKMQKMLLDLPRGDEVHGVQEALLAGPDDPLTEMASLERLKMVLASRPEHTIVVVCHFGVIAALTGCRAKNGDVYECEWGFNDELRVLMRHKTPLSNQHCICS